MGAKMDDLHVEEEKKWFTNQLTTNAKGELCFKVRTIFEVQIFIMIFLGQA